MKVSSSTRFTASTDATSLFMVRRGVSTSTQKSPARTVAERRRPESRLISPKKLPWLDLMFTPGATSIETLPSRIVKKEFV